MPSSSPAEVVNSVLKARIALSLRQPFLASAIMRLPIKDATVYGWCKTMATDGYHVFFNADWVATLSQSEIRGVLAHEVLHILFQHSARRSHRDPELWNIAADHAINLLLLEQGFSLPQGGFANHAYRGMSAEQIYNLLPKKSTFELGDKIYKVGAADNSENSGEIPAIGVDVMDPDNPAVMGARETDMPDRAQLAEICATLRNDAASNLKGDAAGFFNSECTAIEEGRIDWRDLLRGWLVDRIKNDWSMWPCSKKHIHRGLYMPSLGIEAPGHIVFAIDTSGSMSDEALAEVFTELRVYRETYPCRLTVIQCDAAIQTITSYEEMDGEEIPPKVSLFGRGGTDFRPVFNWIDANAVGAYLIYATDGFGSFPDAEQTGGVIWLLTKRHLDVSNFPFGVCVKIQS
jgi:predicted metal-dependent peptidase